jgi:hypothetical protein
VIRVAAVFALAAACNDRTPVRSCGDDLTGGWSTPSGRWMLLDHGKTIEGYPMFDDSVDAGAPRFVSLVRESGPPGGSIERRYMLGANECLAHAPLHVTACTNDTLQIVRGDVAAPLSFVPCAWPQAAPTHVEAWRRD